MPRVTTPAVFDPSKIGVVRHYPKTREAYDARISAARRNTAAAVASGRATRKGVPNGYAGKKGRARAAQHRAEAAAAAAAIARRLLPNVPLRNAQTPDEQLTLMDEIAEWTDVEKGDYAIREALVLALDRTQRPPIRLSALRLVLTFTVPAPLRRRLISLDMALQDLQRTYLDAL